MGVLFLSCINSIFILLIQFKGTNSAVLQESCPTDCICYSDYLTNLASWKWIENDIHSDRDDPEHSEYNPYTEHNEVYENPKSSKSRSIEDPLHTVTCILRNDSAVVLTQTFDAIPSETQVVSLLQASGSGNITLGKSHFEKLHEVIGIEIQGYRHGDSDLYKGLNTFRLSADALLSLRKLTYLSLENVLLQQRSVENSVPEYTTKIVTIRKVRELNNSVTDDDNEVANDLLSQLIFVSPRNPKYDANEILPYSVYKKTEQSEQNQKLQRPLGPKLAVAFTDVPSLLHLRISDCNMQDISWDMFFKLQNLKYLLLEKNDLLFLPDFLFYATPNLTTLSLSENRILNLQTVGLAGLLHLQKLDVTRNNITHLSELSLPPFPHLEVADFRFNPIEAIFPNTFEVMNTTKSLYLGNPKISLQIFPNSFYGLTSLLKLEITNIRIGFLERPMFKGMPQLKSLTMDGSVPKISYDAFSEIAKLERLILRKCGIEKISMDAFFGLTSLIELDLSSNPLHSLPPGIFDDQVSLREIHLQHNKLTTLPPNLFSSTPAKMIRLEGNPWHCSCDMVSWNPSVVNQVKRYHVPINNTFCQPRYDKGSMCFQNQDTPTFQAKYVYEKRVSPVCETPKKFNRRSAFDVLRKELRYCHSKLTPVSTPSPESIKLESIFKLKKKLKPNQNKTTVIIKTEEQLLKEQDKIRFSQEKKAKKPSKKDSIKPIRVPVPSEQIPTETNGPDDSISEPEPELATTQPKIVSSTGKISHSAEKPTTPNPKPSEPDLKNTEVVKLVEEVTDSIHSIPINKTSPESFKPVRPKDSDLWFDTQLPMKIPKMKPLTLPKLPKPVKNSNSKDPNSHRPLPISKKAWKLAKLYRMQIQDNKYEK